MLALMVKAMRDTGRRPGALYLDNGSTYRGEVLQTLCARLGVGLLHAEAEDPQARGKMERFWRTLREGCVDHLGTPRSLHDVQVRLLAFLGQHYHVPTRIAHGQDARPGVRDRAARRKAGDGR